jgi:hypothetical protein
MRRVFIVVALVLSGCGPEPSSAVAMHPPISPVTGLVVADGISVINTKKTVEDHIVSTIFDEDCSSVRASQGGRYCVDDKPPPTVQRTDYCYKTIAETTCYERPVAADTTMFTGTRTDAVPVANH